MHRADCGNMCVASGALQNLPFFANCCRDLLVQLAVLRLQAVSLRREKSTLINGKPIVILPPKIINVVELPFSPAVHPQLLLSPTSPADAVDHALEHVEACSGYSDGQPS